ncbi:uncharacterized protein OCT59_004032 [Rhizophagus irregularis]|uniref:Uncharacterized protein n=1 Tax=Rhizophagus irregularis TaxID=588596 RepID=A0A915ZJL5_9GLOM|nr:hypothetical protein OCT59_004032 [Rhizophagus irregularis]GBC53432.1 hypothetical protein RIR_jg19144.t1 [Rhizophagus irregularis DAOM 181602=DAOM 197198]CAB5379802.1 unnamed protein product [Rhizophagus irregularis]
MRALIHKGYIENTIDSLATKSSQMEDILIPKYKDLWAEFAWDSDSALCVLTNSQECWPNFHKFLHTLYLAEKRIIA